MNQTATLPARRFRIGFWTGVFGIIFLPFLVVTFLRFFKGLGAVTNLSDKFPWGALDRLRSALRCGSRGGGLHHHGRGSPFQPTEV